MKLIYLNNLKTKIVISASLAEFDPKYVQKIIEMSSLEPKIGIETRQSSKTVATFNCPPLNPSNPKPTSVHQLRPSDIEVVSAIGDSLTVWTYFFLFFLFIDS